MKRAIWVVLGLVLIAGIAVGAVAAASGGSNTIYVDTSYSGKEVEISIGESLVVTLPSNASTGYSWKLAENSDEGVLQEVGHEYIATQTNLVGAAGKELWTFKALQDGTSTIHMEYIRPWEAGTPPAETFSLTVVVN
jgi:inhibitor of cysteine peptidase